MTTPIEMNDAIVALEREIFAILDASADGIITFDALGFVVGSNLSAPVSYTHLTLPTNREV